MKKNRGVGVVQGSGSEKMTQSNSFFHEDLKNVLIFRVVDSSESQPQLRDFWRKGAHRKNKFDSTIPRRR